MKKKVLVLEGGGLRGIISTTILKNLQRKLGVSLNDYFDIFIGTSTGAIIASMLSAGIDIEVIHKMYVDNGKHIFTPQNSWWLPWRKATRPLYDRDRVRNPMKQLLDSVGVSTMKDLKRRFICTSVNVLTNENIYFKSTSEEYANLSVLDAVTRSYSAPMYFSLFRDDVNKTYWSDGGTGLGNFPIIPGYMEACSLNPDEIEITAVGTGYSKNTDTFKDASSWENFGQLWNLYFKDGEILARTQVRLEQVNAMKWICSRNKNVTFNYYDIEIPQKIDKLDGKDFVQDYIKYGNSVPV